MSWQEYIVIRGARENNLKNVSLQIPKRKITVFTGVSGSGKSSLVFDTIGAEAQRLLNETYTAFIRNRLPKFKQPDTDAIENLSPAIVIDQRRLGGNSRSTVGTITDIYSILRLLYSRVGMPFVGYSHVFSFNDPAGMCPDCQGLGKKMELDIGKIFDKSKSLNEGAILFPVFAVGSWYLKTYTLSGLFDNDKKLADYSEQEWDMLLYGKGKKIKLPSKGGPIQSDYEGVVPKFQRLYIQRDSNELSESTKHKVERFITQVECPTCKGTRLSQKSLSCTINGYNIAECVAMELGELFEVVSRIDDPVAAPMVSSLTERLQHLIDVGLEYLSLNRETTTLSGGESQRIKMVRQFCNSLTDMVYIFDEPSIGLHPRDIRRLNQLLRKLCDKGNTILVVEHDPDVIRIADHIVDVGPRAGTEGGRIVFEGTVRQLYNSATLTGQHLNRPWPLKETVRAPKGHFRIEGATSHNLKDVTVSIPQGVLTAITGVAGSGKSSLVHHEFITRYPEAAVIDQSAVHTSIRSNPATYTGIMDMIRNLFAKANRKSASLFSFNSKGACPDCQGLGFIYTDLAFMEGIKTACETCEGRRFRDEVLHYKWREKSITDVLDMTVWGALDFFEQREIVQPLQALNDVGLGYLTLGQPLNTLSGGECQRVKLANELHKEGHIYVMDEPTTGLHMADVGQLLAIMNRLVDQGSTVIVIEHHLDIIRQADWIIDLGPEGGSKGGRVVFEGTPRQLLNAKGSTTGMYIGQ
ncbi:MAG: excinuclease ABC subunit UvrA [Paenibacillus macerans]|uniref:ATP-binding cassette domain-containing protein n=1 Tax=Paenibacillus macerans TaxID=44252 RepID=UPI000EDDA8E8|nr:excinuclease ABC subunit UvrA [Paenibacillus macerans]MDU7473566.1 excinuclease ABC subunit UvrA [Paenibacillus macerans]GBK61940.1 excinuclease ABC subunit UvrA [Paenibacillus macerans]GBK68247.1 excinuclease ABC subunit UvrA [Paenibacillus macerans]